MDLTILKDRETAAAVAAFILNLEQELTGIATKMTLERRARWGGQDVKEYLHMGVAAALPALLRKEDN